MENRKEHVGTRQVIHDRTETGQTTTPVRTKLAKTHQDYWTQRLRKRPYIDRQGRSAEVPTWQVRIQYLGKESWFNLDTANRAHAAIKARDVYVFLRANGWDQAFARFKPETVAKVDSPTVAEFFAEVRLKAGLRSRTLAGYERKFRKIVADIRGIRSDGRKFDQWQGGHDAWLAQVERTKLHEITPERIQAWKLAYLSRVAGDPVREKAARNTVNSFIRNARSLFSESILKHLTGITVPRPTPFTDVALERGGSMKYHSEINPRVLWEAARRDLSEQFPAQFMIFILALGAGLRRNEIDKMEWSWIDWENAVIRVKPTRYFQPKTDESEADVEVSKDLLELIRPYMCRATDAFVVPGNRPRLTPTYDSYRCDFHLKQLNEWLRSKGITARNPLHSLRKEFGSLLCDRFGIWQASRALRHQSIQTTQNHYIDKKSRAVLDVGQFMAAPLMTELQTAV
jgi:integrase